MISESFAKKVFIRNWIGRGGYDDLRFQLLNKVVPVMEEDIEEFEEARKVNDKFNEELEVFALWLLDNSPFTDVNLGDTETLRDLVDKVNKETAIMSKDEAVKLRNRVAFNVIQIATRDWLPFMPVVYKPLCKEDAEALKQFCTGSNTGKMIFTNAVNGVLEETPVRLMNRFKSKTGRSMSFDLVNAFRLSQWELKIIDSAKEKKEAIMCTNLTEVEEYRQLCSKWGKRYSLDESKIKTRTAQRGIVTPVNLGYVFVGSQLNVEYKFEEKILQTDYRPLVSGSVFRVGARCSLQDSEQVPLAFIIKAIRLIFGVDDFGLKIDRYLFPSNCLNSLDLIDLDFEQFREYYPTSLKNYAMIRCLEYYDQRPFLKLGCIGGNFVLANLSGQPKTITSFDRNGKPITIVQDKGIYSYGSYAIWMDEMALGSVLLVPMSEIHNIVHLDVMRGFPSKKALANLGFDCLINISDANKY